jgi:hypothetical protein
MVMSMAVALAAARGSALLDSPIDLVTLFRHAGRHPRHRARRLAPIDAGRHSDQLGEATAEGATDEQPTAKQTSVMLRSPRRSSAIARSMRRVIRQAYGDSP